MDRQIRRLALALVVLLGFVFAQLSYLQVFAADRLANNPNNRRLLLEEYNVQRGEILARDEQTVLATSSATTGNLKFLRVYPRGPLYGQVTGYDSVLFGRSDLESTYNDYLQGRATALLPQNLVDEILGRPKRGASIVTTIDPKLQATAAKALGTFQGGVVALDPRTGDVLALVANPRYDPNPLASHDPKVEAAAQRALITDPAKPLIARTSEELFPPGSTFKLVTASAALENGMTPQTRFPNPPSLPLPDTTAQLHNFGQAACAGGVPQLTLAEALTVSCNVVFGQVGLKLGAEKLVAQAEKYGFNGHVPFDVPFAEGRIPPVSAFANARPTLAFSAVGEDSVVANPLQMALVGAAIANGGVEMAPRLVSEVRDPSGNVVHRIGPSQYSVPISPRTASEMTQMMVNVVQAGTGTAAQIPGVTVAGKTGTAVNPSGPPYAWFVCFAPAEHPSIAVAVLVQNGGNLGNEATGGAVAAPIARAVLEAALNR